MHRLSGSFAFFLFNMYTPILLLHRFGIIADVQYADIEDGLSFLGDEKRMYREARLEIGA